MRRNVVDLMVLVAIGSSLLIEPAEGGRRQKYCGQMTNSCSTPAATCCSPQPAICSPSPCAAANCSSGCYAPFTWFCEASNAPAFAIGGVNYYPGTRFDVNTPNCGTAGNPGTQVTYPADPPAVHNCPDGMGNFTPFACGCIKTFGYASDPCGTVAAEAKRPKLDKALIPDPDPDNNTGFATGDKARVIGKTWCNIIRHGAPIKIQLEVIKYHHPGNPPKIPSFCGAGAEIAHFPGGIVDVPTYNFDEMNNSVVIVHAGLDFVVVLATP